VAQRQCWEAYQEHLPAGMASPPGNRRAVRLSAGRPSEKPERECSVRPRGRPVFPRTVRRAGRANPGGRDTAKTHQINRLLQPLGCSYLSGSKIVHRPRLHDFEPSPVQATSRDNKPVLRKRRKGRKLKPPPNGNFSRFSCRARKTGFCIPTTEWITDGSTSDDKFSRVGSCYALSCCGLRSRIAPSR
jgi:hypothetical protein